MAAAQVTEKEDTRESNPTALKPEKVLLRQAITETTERLGKENYHTKEFGEAVKLRLEELKKAELERGLELAEQSSREISNLEKRLEAAGRNSTELQGIASLADEAIGTLRLPAVTEGIAQENANVNNEAITEVAKAVHETNIALTIRTERGTFRGIDAKVSIDEDGKLSVTEKSLNSGKETNLSANFSAIYLGSDNILRDSSGNEIKQLTNGLGGNINTEFIASQMIDKTNLSQNGIAGLKHGYLNNLTHEGKQVVFVKGNPPTSSSSEKIDETKSSDDVIKSDDKVKSQNTEIRPWFKHSYSEKVNGCWQQRTCYLREVNENGKQGLQVFLGKDKNGAEIWRDSTSVSGLNLQIVEVDKATGSMKINGSSNVTNFDTLSGSKLDASNVFSMLDKTTGAVKSNYLNELLVNGKRPVFILK